MTSDSPGGSEQKRKRSPGKAAASKSQSQRRSGNSASSDATDSEQVDPRAGAGEDTTRSPGASQSAQDDAPWWYAGFTETDNPADVSNAAQEAVKLAAAVAAWANDTGLSARLQGVMEQTSESLKSAVRSATQDPVDDHQSDADEVQSPGFDCASCPICQGMRALEQHAPASAPGLSAALAGVTQALMETVDALTSVTSDSNSKVEHITID